MVYLHSRPRMGAWIEIKLRLFTATFHQVAPVWGRGLKSGVTNRPLIHLCRPRMGAWIEIKHPIGNPRPWKSPPYGGVD